jgi:hypothetical protein
MQGNLFGAASLELPWAKSGDATFDSAGGQDQIKQAALPPVAEVVEIHPSKEIVAAEEETLDDRLSRLRDMLKGLDQDLPAPEETKASA